MNGHSGAPARTHASGDSGRVASIDILRGLTILWVMAYHLWSDQTHRFAGSEPLYIAFRDRVLEGHAYAAATALLDLVVGSGYQGVIVFMMLSGVSLTMNAHRHGEPAILKGYKSRFRKLLVPYWAGTMIIVGAIAVIALLQMAIDGGTFLQQWDRVTLDHTSPVKLRAEGVLQGLSVFGDFVRDMHGFQPSSQALWFVPLLLQYYLVFPFAFRLLNRVGPWPFLVIGMVLLFVARTAAHSIAMSHFDFIVLAHWENLYAPLRGSEFIIGMALGSLFVHHHEAVREWTAATLDIAGILLLAALLQLAGSVMPGRSPLFNTLSFPIMHVGLALFAVPLLFKPAGRLESTWPAKALSFLGVLAFAALITNECMRFVSSFLQYEGVPDAIWWSFIVAIYIPVGTLLAYPLAGVLGLLPRQRAARPPAGAMHSTGLGPQPASGN